MSQSDTARQEFAAEVFKVGINPCVDVPAKVSKTFGGRGYVPVTGELNGRPIRATLVPIGNGRHRLYINQEMRKQAKVGVGDKIHLTLAIDEKPRTLPMPKEFEVALAADETAKAAFDKLPPSHQREILAYLNSLKKPETLKRNVRRAIDSLVKHAGGSE